MDSVRPVNVRCNYIESLLGIETPNFFPTSGSKLRRCNYIESLLGIETSWAYLKPISV